MISRPYIKYGTQPGILSEPAFVWGFRADMANGVHQDHAAEVMRTHGRDLRREPAAHGRAQNGGLLEPQGIDKVMVEMGHIRHRFEPLGSFRGPIAWM